MTLKCSVRVCGVRFKTYCSLYWSSCIHHALWPEKWLKFYDVSIKLIKFSPFLWLLLLLFTPHSRSLTSFISALVILLLSPLPRSCREQSDYQEFSGSASAEDEYPPIRRHLVKLDMTRLDPPPHRPNPRAWMDDSRSRDSFSRHSGTCRLTLCVAESIS